MHLTKKYNDYKSTPVTQPKSSKRHLARCRAMQAIYQWQHTQQSRTDLIQQFLEEQEMNHAEIDYFQTLIAGVLEHIVEIDEIMCSRLDRTISALNPVELAILRIAIYELKFHLEIPYRVIINEALEITKRYGSVDGFKYVNAILDALVPSLREVEVRSRKK